MTTSLTHLIGPQDLQAYVDGALSEDRKRAVEAYAADNDAALAELFVLTREAAALRRGRAEIYHDVDLAEAVTAAMRDVARAVRAGDREPG